MALVRCRRTDHGRRASRMPARKSSTSLAVDGPLRDEAATAAERAGMPVGQWLQGGGGAAAAAPAGAGRRVGQWLERALRMAADGEAEPAPPEGVEIGELEAMVRRVVAEELRPVRETLERLEARTPTPSSAGVGPVSLMRDRRRQRRQS